MEEKPKKKSPCTLTPAWRTATDGKFKAGHSIAGELEQALSVATQPLLLGFIPGKKDGFTVEVAEPTSKLPYFLCTWMLETNSIGSDLFPANNTSMPT